MTSSPSGTVRPGDLSALPTVRGVPAWAALLIAVIATGLGVTFNMMATPADGQSTGWPLRILYVAGAIVAVLAVRRRAVFTAMVQPPLILAAALLIGGLLDSAKGVLFAGVDVVKAFPLMVVGTAAAIVLGLVRMIVQPLRQSTTVARQNAHA